MNCRNARKEFYQKLIINKLQLVVRLERALTRQLEREAKNQKDETYDIG